MIRIESEPELAGFSKLHFYLGAIAHLFGELPDKIDDSMLKVCLRFISRRRSYRFVKMNPDSHFFLQIEEPALLGLKDLLEAGIKR